MIRNDHYDGVLLRLLSSVHLCPYPLGLQTLPLGLLYWHFCLFHFQNLILHLILLLSFPSTQTSHCLGGDWDRVNRCLSVWIREFPGAVPESNPCSSFSEVFFSLASDRMRDSFSSPSCLGASHFSVKTKKNYNHRKYNFQQRLTSTTRLHLLPWSTTLQHFPSSCQVLKAFFKAGRWKDVSAAEAKSDKDLSGLLSQRFWLHTFRWMR